MLLSKYQFFSHNSYSIRCCSDCYVDLDPVNPWQLLPHIQSSSCPSSVSHRTHSQVSILPKIVSSNYTVVKNAKCYMYQSFMCCLCIPSNHTDTSIFLIYHVHWMHNTNLAENLNSHNNTVCHHTTTEGSKHIACIF